MDPQAQVASYLGQSLDPSGSKNAETQLRSAETQPGFALVLLKIIESQQYDNTIRLAGSLFFKNFLKRQWADDDGKHGLAEQDSSTIKSNIVPLMIASPPNIQAQLGEAVNVIADTDFPQNWTNLIDDLVSQLDQNDFLKTVGVLQTAHAIFKRWRPLFRTDDLFREIQFVLDKFAAPFLAIFTATHQQIQQNSSDRMTVNRASTALLLECKIFYDLNCQDIPEFFEDNMQSFMSVFHLYLGYKNPILDTDDDDNPGQLEEIKTSICEILQLYAQRYEEVFTSLPDFLNTVWELLTTTGPEPKNDLLVSKAMSFLTTVIRNPRHAQLLNSEDTLKQFIERVVIPNMRLRDSDLELFEDDPIEFIRRDLEGSDSDTRRRSASDLVSGLMDNFESNVSGAMMNYIGIFLKEFQQNPSKAFLSKDMAYYLLSSIAIRTQSAKRGVSSTNVLVDLVEFYSTNVLSDLKSKDIHPILRTDAIRFVHLFRNQLTVEQLRAVLPILIDNLGDRNYIVHTYAAIAVEKISSLERDGTMVFTPDFVGPMAPNIFSAIFKKLQEANNTQKLAENDYLMRCLVRTLLTIKEKSRSSVDFLSRQQAIILNEVSKNPSNPKFNHYLFESIGSLIRFSGPQESARLQENFFPVFQNILQNEVTGIDIEALWLDADSSEFIPYVFQILAKMIDNSSQGLPDFVKGLVNPCLAPSLWESKGNTPPLTKFLQSVISKDPQFCLDNKYIEPMLGVFQKLISSRSSDHYGFDLLETLFFNFPPDVLVGYLGHISSILLTRLQASRTERYLLRFVSFAHFVSALYKTNYSYGPDFMVRMIEGAQAGVFYFRNTMYAEIAESNRQKAGNHRINARSHLSRNKFESIRATLVGLIGLSVSNNDSTPSLIAVLKLLEMPTEITRNSDQIEEVDFEDLSYQAAYTKLSTVSSDRFDPCSDIKDEKAFFVATLNALHEQSGSSQIFLSAVNQIPSDAQLALKGYGIKALS